MRTSSILRKKKLELSISGVLLLSIACGVHGGANSDNKDKTVTPPLEFYDADKDEHISAEEAAAQGMSSRVFKSLDINHDGKLSKDEFSKMPPLHVDER